MTPEQRIAELEAEIEQLKARIHWLKMLSAPFGPTPYPSIPTQPDMSDPVKVWTAEGLDLGRFGEWWAKSP